MCFVDMSECGPQTLYITKRIIVNEHHHVCCTFDMEIEGETAWNRNFNGNITALKLAAIEQNVDN